MSETHEHPNTLHAVVKGRVQGVGFRVFVRQAALRLGVDGWVRNLPGGEVEIHAQADETLLTDLLTELLKGPPWSHVADIDVTWEHHPKDQEGFRILR